ncbi:MAG: GHKL domain-containing protein [Acholeplasmataceae bacterium]|nr:GHKL domain-containing protein [Acholeplasmataceae bacterium]
MEKAGVDDLTNWHEKPFAVVADDSEVKKVLKSGKALNNIDFDIHGLKTVGDIIPITIGGTLTGAIVSVNERTAIKEMAEQLTGVTNYADALRAQTHEFMNKMHVINGLLATDNLTELKKYVQQISSSDEVNMEYITSRIKDPLLSGFLIGKKSRANELQLDFSLSEESFFPADLSKIIAVNDIILIIGNLLENSFEALRFLDKERIVNLAILTYEDELIITVENNGPAISSDVLAKIFKKGYTTKGSGHGVGLFLVKEKLATIGGKISVESDILDGTIFTVEIPIKEGAKT